MKNRDQVLSDLGIVFFLVLTFVTITFFTARYGPLYSEFSDVERYLSGDIDYLFQ